MKSILDQFQADAINAPETVTGGSGRRTHRRTRRHHTRGSRSLSSGRRTHRRTRRHHTRNS